MGPRNHVTPVAVLSFDSSIFAEQPSGGCPAVPLPHAAAPAPPPHAACGATGGAPPPAAAWALHPRCGEGEGRILVVGLAAAKAPTT